MNKIFSLLLGFMLLGTAAIYAQGNIDEALATEFYQKGEYDKSAALYKKLLDRNPGSAYYYDYYLNSLIKLKDYETAERELKRFIKKSDNSLLYRIDLGYVYALEGDEKKSRQTFDDVIDALMPDEQMLNTAAAAFSRREQSEYAIKTYEKGRKLFKSDQLFTTELAELYKTTGNYEAMFSEYLKMMEANPYNMEAVKDAMQDVVMQDAPYEVLKKMLLKKTQAAPDDLIYPDMLSWLFLQRKDFNSAFIQTKAIDRRNKEGGRRLVELARIVAGNQQLELAERIYQAVLDKGTEAPYYIPAQRGLLDIKYTRVTQTGNYTAEDVKSLLTAYDDFIAKYGMQRKESGDVVLRLAEIRAQYAGQIKEAIELLKTFIAFPGIEKPLVARAKLALGDYSILAGDQWEATLYYSQVEKMYKDDPLGHEAKFRNAKLSFYMGDFDWAKAQLDVLKSSTSELIANDAMQLALLIQDNLGLDTTERPLKLYAEADFLIFKNLLGKAQEKLDSINLLFPNHSLDDEILMDRAAIAFKKRDYAQTYTYYEQVFTKFGEDILADDALFKAAQLQEAYLNNPDKAKDLYEKIMLNYQGSVYAVEARSRYRKLRGDVVN